MEEIARLVWERNREKKVLSKEDIKRISEIIIGENKYTNIKKILIKKVSPIDEEFAGECLEDRIYFYQIGLEKSLELDYEELAELGRLQGSKIEAYNFSCLSTIFHEFAHARQDLMVLKQKRNRETKLYSIANKLFEMSYNFYMDNYEYMPTEVNAFVKGSLDAYSIYKKFPKGYLSRKDDSIYSAYILQKIQSFYEVDVKEDQVISPTENLMVSADEYNLSKHGIQIEDFAKIVMQENKESLYQRVLVGLPMKYSEYAYINLLKDALKEEEQVPILKKLQKKI